MTFNTACGTGLTSLGDRQGDSGSNVLSDLDGNMELQNLG